MLQFYIFKYSLTPHRKLEAPLENICEMKSLI